MLAQIVIIIIIIRLAFRKTRAWNKQKYMNDKNSVFVGTGRPQWHNRQPEHKMTTGVWAGGAWWGFGPLSRAKQYFRAIAKFFGRKTAAMMLVLVHILVLEVKSLTMSLHLLSAPRLHQHHAVERVFSLTGFIMRPHRAKMRDCLMGGGHFSAVLLTRQQPSRPRQKLPSTMSTSQKHRSAYKYVHITS